MSDIPSSNSSLSSDRLNFILAICAILISGASFYATYLQAESAEAQVKAMTLPLIQFGHGNYDQERELRVINFELKNAGVGPAIIKSVRLKYQQQEYQSLKDYFVACCDEALKESREKQRAAAESGEKLETTDWVSQPLLDVIIPGQSNYVFQQIYYTPNTDQFWDVLNKERWNLMLNICYCSLLDDCFTTEKNGVVESVSACPA
ncbi:MAG: hypothetical protein AAF431_13225 [Pseudomonadota bacterium]